jgi:hypothetical protein
MTGSFLELAQQRKLSSVVNELAPLTWDVDADGYQRLKVPRTADVTPLLRLALRRGVDPTIAAALLARFETRPLERALIAWDVAAGTLLSDDDESLVQQLRACVAPLKALGPLAASAVPRDRVAGLIAAVTAAGEVPLAGSEESMPGLAAISTLSATDTAGIDAALALSRKLALAHLPSLSLAIAQVLWERLQLPEALDRLVETGLDFERFDSIPPLTGAPQVYAATRLALSQLSLDVAEAVLAQQGDLQDPRFTLVRAELQVLADEPLSPQTIDAVQALAPIDSTWRYAARVRTQLEVQRAPVEAVYEVENFQSWFGNDVRVWAQAGLVMDDGVRAALLRLVSREVRYSAYDPEAWRALLCFADEGMPIEVELQQRVAAQLTATYA